MNEKSLERERERLPVGIFRNQGDKLKYVDTVELHR